MIRKNYIVLYENKILGMVATIGGVAATLLTDWVNEKKMDKKIDEAINAKLAALDDEEDEEP